MFTDQLSPCGSSDEMDSELDSNNDDLSSNFSNNSGSKRQKRGILPKQATSVMRAWLFQHLVVSGNFLLPLYCPTDKQIKINFFFCLIASLSNWRRETCHCGSNKFNIVAGKSFIVFQKITTPDKIGAAAWVEIKSDLEECSA